MSTNYVLILCSVIPELSNYNTSQSVFFREQIQASLLPEIASMQCPGLAEIKGYHVRYWTVGK